jgi:hypothetical protein
VSSLDLGGLVLVASHTLDLDEEAVLALADLDAAESVLTLARECRGGPAQEAAVLLVGLVRRRVFGPRSAEVAVMAAVQLLALNRQEVGDLGSPAELRELVAAIAAGQLVADELVAWLAERLGPGAAPSRAARLLSRRLKNPRNPGDPRSADDRMEGEMFERFTNRARNVVKLAQTEARRLDHQQIGTEHVLLGLVREGDGVAAKILVESGADLPVVRQEVLRLLSTGVTDRAGPEPPKDRLIADIEALYEEIVRLAKEVDRLTELLRAHGIEPDEGTSRSA